MDLKSPKSKQYSDIADKPINEVWRAFGRYLTGEMPAKGVVVQMPHPMKDDEPHGNGRIALSPELYNALVDAARKLKVTPATLAAAIISNALKR
jgi:hypothetical protein